MKHKLNCKTCNKEIYAWEYQKDTKKYCSKECAKVTFFKKGQPSHNKGLFGYNAGENNPCWKGGKITKNCEYCLKEYKVGQSRKDTARFCSYSCRSLTTFRDKPHPNKGKRFPERSGVNSFNWIFDRNTVIEKHRLRGTQEWKDWRVSVFERDKYTCQECGDCGVYLEPHHIIPIRSDMDKLFNTNNGITLCRPCHQKTIWKEEDFADKYFALTNSK